MGGLHIMTGEEHASLEVLSKSGLLELYREHSRTPVKPGYIWNLRASPSAIYLLSPKHGCVTAYHLLLESFVYYWRFDAWLPFPSAAYITTK